LQLRKDEDDKYKKGDSSDTQTKSSEELVKLLESLLTNIKTRKPKKCAPMNEEISKIIRPEHLDKNVKELIKLIGKYKFKEAETISKSIINKLSRGV
jgi:hypothetical protein